MAAIRIPTEPIGSLPRPRDLQDAISEGCSQEEVEKRIDEAVADTIRNFEATGSPVITDGEQRRQSFATYPLKGLTNITPSSGGTIVFADGHTRTLPTLNRGPFVFGSYAVEDIRNARRLTSVPLKQSVISASLLTLLYPEAGLPDYSREKFLEDVVKECTKDICMCLDEGVSCVQIDFTEGRLAIKLDPSKALLKSFIDINNRVLEQFSAEERRRLGVHTCPGGDHNSTHSADVDYMHLLPALFQLKVDNFYMQLSSERNPEQVWLAS